MRRRRRQSRGAAVHALAGRERDGDSPDDKGAPEVRLGRTEPNGVSPSMYGLLERGVMLRPEVASEIRGRVVFRFTDSIAPLRVMFAGDHMTVEDGDLHDPDLTIVGTLPDVIHFVATPLVGGIPNPARIRGLVAIARVARRRVRIEGDPGMARSVLRLLSL